jgi:hypothetical protein
VALAVLSHVRDMEAWDMMRERDEMWRRDEIEYDDIDGYEELRVFEREGMLWNFCHAKPWLCHGFG